MSTLATMVLLSGCMDSSVSSPNLVSAAPANMMLAPQGMPQLSLNGDHDDNTSVDFTVGPEGGTYRIGNHALVIPRNGICDPATSSYGVGTWNSPCKALKKALKMHAEVLTKDGRTWVDLSPEIRYVYSDNPSNWAYISIYLPAAIGAKDRDLAKFNIDYALSIGGVRVDESVQDATERTYVDTRHGIVTRRIKHHTGYTSSGFQCDPANASCP